MSGIDSTIDLTGRPVAKTARDHQEAWLAVADYVSPEALEARGIAPMVEGQATTLPLGMVAELLAVAHQRAREARERARDGETR